MVNEKLTNKLTLNAEIRTDMGTGASRRLRHANKVPAIIYGVNEQPQLITLEHNAVIKALENEEFYTQILTLNIAKKSEEVVLKDLQRHVFKPKILHLDFMRIKADEEINMTIPLRFVGEIQSPGAKQGGIASHHISEIEIRCLPANLPKYIEVDASNLELNDVIHLSEIKLPKGVKLTIITDVEHDQAVASIHLSKITEVTKGAEEETVEAETVQPMEGKQR